MLKRLYVSFNILCLTYNQKLDICELLHNINFSSRVFVRPLLTFNQQQYSNKIK